MKEALQDTAWLEVLTNIIRDSVVAELKATIERNSDVITELKKTLLEKDKKISELESKIDNLEQYQRRQCVRIFGIVEEENEDTNKIAIDVAQKIGVELNVSDIDRSHRVGRRDGDKPRPIIVKFVSYRKRWEIFSNKRKLKGSKITVREDLTKVRHAILREAITRFGLNSVWTSDGVIIVNHQGTKRRIVRMEDLQNM